MINERKKYKVLLYILLLSIILLSFLLISIGRVKLPFGEVVNVLLTNDKESLSYNVIVNLRLYRVLVSMVIGASLAISGSIYQSIFNNKLVSPDILGVSSGASVGACLAILLSLSSFMVNIFAFTFGIISVGACLLIAYKISFGSNIVLILSGIAVSGFMSSIVGLLKFLADNEFKLSEMTFWLLGDLSKVGRNELVIILPIFIICFIVALTLSWRLDIISLGKKESIILGNNYNIFLIIYITIATILTTTSVAMCGIISWVGLIIPNIVRLLIGNNNRNVLPITALLGAIFLSIADTFARTISPSEIPLSVITGIVGTPVFVIILFKRKKQVE